MQLSFLGPSPADSRCFKCPRLCSRFPSLSRTAVLGVDSHIQRCSPETLPWMLRGCLQLAWGPSKKGHLNQSNHRVHPLSFPSARIEILCSLLTNTWKEQPHIFYSFVIVCCRTGLLPVIARIGSLPLKHSFLICVLFFFKDKFRYLN